MPGYQDTIPQSLQTDELNQSVPVRWRPLLRTGEINVFEL